MRLSTKVEFFNQQPIFYAHKTQGLRSRSLKKHRTIEKMQLIDSLVACAGQQLCSLSFFSRRKLINCISKCYATVATFVLYKLHNSFSAGARIGLDMFLQIHLFFLYYEHAGALCNFKDKDISFFSRFILTAFRVSALVVALTKSKWEEDVCSTIDEAFVERFFESDSVDD
jgi:hypothetical protein